MNIRGQSEIGVRYWPKVATQIHATGVRFGHFAASHQQNLNGSFLVSGPS